MIYSSDDRCLNQDGAEERKGQIDNNGANIESTRYLGERGLWKGTLNVIPLFLGRIIWKDSREGIS